MKRRGGELTAELIVKKAAELFHEKGYHATSMSDIAGAVGIEKAALYYHFPSKNAIIERILHRLLSDEFLPKLEAIVRSSAPLDVRFRQFIRFQVLHLTDNIPQAAVSKAILQLKDPGLTPELTRWHLEQNTSHRQLIVQLVTEGIEGGTFRDIDPAFATLAILGMVNWVIQWYRPDGTLSAEQIADRFADMILRSLLVEPLPRASISR